MVAEGRWTLGEQRGNYFCFLERFTWKEVSPMLQRDPDTTFYWATYEESKLGPRSV